jgi:dTDP-4-dehydrorhamnose reductase
MRVAVIGANGQLGSDVAAVFRTARAEVLPLTHADVEITAPDSLARVLGELRPEVIVNTAAFSNVPLCETEVETAFNVNALGARNVACAAAHLGAKLFHISTDYVFDGSKRAPYVEENLPAPLSVYAASKLAGEHLVRAYCPQHFVLRVCGIYGHHPCRAKGGPNFIELMLQLARDRGEVRVVDDEFVTPTPTVEIARQIVALAPTAEFGLYHATSEGQCSWFEFTQAIFELTGTKAKLERANPGEFATQVARPKYSVLENAALKRNGLNVFRPWKEGLKEYLATREPRARQTTGVSSSGN